jgi:hypothetical protein
MQSESRVGQTRGDPLEGGSQQCRWLTRQRGHVTSVGKRDTKPQRVGRVTCAGARLVTRTGVTKRQFVGGPSQSSGGMLESQSEGGQAGRAIGAAGPAGGRPRKKVRLKRTAGEDTPS